ncbi:PRA1 family protein 3-like [Anableps anableps]
MPPLRHWGDFFPGWKSFARPTDSSNLHDRLMSNLLYYQTNYLVLSTPVYVISGFKDPVGVLTGMAIMLAVFLLSAWVGELQPVVSFKRWSPLGFLITLLVVIHLVTFKLVNGRIFLSANTISLAVTVSHASFCIRNMNEVTCMKEAQELKGTPMGFLLMARGRK